MFNFLPLILAGRKIAIDASMSIYQFLIAVRTEGANLTNEEGETTSHINGIFYRTIRMVSHGIKPVSVHGLVFLIFPSTAEGYRDACILIMPRTFPLSRYVFDGKPPTLKSGELAKRTERRAQAQESLDVATEAGELVSVLLSWLKEDSIHPELRPPPFPQATRNKWKSSLGDWSKCCRSTTSSARNFCDSWASHTLWYGRVLNHGWSFVFNDLLILLISASTRRPVKPKPSVQSW